MGENLTRIDDKETVAILQLPSETICEIFFALRFNAEKCPPNAPKWIAITHVCQHLRDVALACPSLWATLDFSMPRFVETMIARSGNMPLVVEYNGTTCPQGHLKDALHAALSQITRLRSVTIEPTTYNGIDWTPLFSEWKKGAPILDNIRLSALATYWIRKDVLTLSAPSLRRVSISSSIPFLWEEMPFNGNITHLHLLGRHVHVHQRPDILTFVRTLQGMPQLHELHLAAYLPLDPIPVCTSGASLSIALPFLHNLFLHDTESFIATVLSLFHLPRVLSATLYTHSPVSASQERDASNQVFANLQTATSCWNQFHDIDRVMLSVPFPKRTCSGGTASSDVGQGFQIGFKIPTQHGVAGGFTTTPRLILGLHSKDHINNVLDGFHRYFNLSTASSFSWSVTPSMTRDWPLQEWPSVLDLLKGSGPQTIFISGRGLLKLLHHLQTRAIDVNCPTSSHPLRGLTHLVLKDLWENNGVIPNGWPTVLKLLADVLQGLPLATGGVKVEFRLCDFLTREMVEGFRQECPSGIEVIWDGIREYQYNHEARWREALDTEI